MRPLFGTGSRVRGHHGINLPFQVLRTVIVSHIFDSCQGVGVQLALGKAEHKFPHSCNAGKSSREEIQHQHAGAQEPPMLVSSPGELQSFLLTFSQRSLSRLASQMYALPPHPSALLTLQATGFCHNAADALERVGNVREGNGRPNFDKQRVALRAQSFPRTRSGFGHRREVGHSPLFAGHS